MSGYCALVISDGDPLIVYPRGLEKRTEINPDDIIILCSKEGKDNAHVAIHGNNYTFERYRVLNPRLKPIVDKKLKTLEARTG